MATKTVKQFANWIGVIDSEINDLKRAPLGSAERALNARLYKFVMWLLEQADKRAALDMNIDDFMAQCSVAVRDAALALVREAKAELKALRAAAAKPVAAKAAPAKKAVRKRKAKAERTDLMSAEDYAEMLQKLDPFEAARIQAEE
jgi:hypothetical protein